MCFLAFQSHEQILLGIERSLGQMKSQLLCRCFQWNHDLTCGVCHGALLSSTALPQAISSGRSLGLVCTILMH